MEALIHSVMDWFGMPTVGLPAVFIVAAVSATLIPMGSEPIGINVADTAATINTAGRPTVGIPNQSITE